MYLFSGTSNVNLAKEVATIVGLSLGRAEVTRFIDSECRVRILEDVSNQDVFVLQSLSTVADQNLVELCLFATALKSLGAKRITAVIPWMGYSKQDKAFRKGEAISSQLVAKMIEAAGFDNVITVELHSESIKQYFQIPIVEVSTSKLLVDTLCKNSSLSLDVQSGNTVVVSPDKGGASRSERFAKEAHLPIMYLEKTRSVLDGKVTITALSSDVNGKSVILFDDIINTGSTAIEASNYLKNHGATHVIFLATHAVFAGDAVLQLSKSMIDKIVVTNTISIPKEKLFSTVSMISVSPLLAAAITDQMK